MNKLTINRVISAIITIALLSFSLVGCDGYINNAIQEKRANDTVSRAQNSCNEVLPNITYKDAYEHFFSEPQWRGFTTLDNHEIVEFTGNCTYKDEQALAYIEFVEGQDGTFSANYARLTIRGERIELAKDEMMFLMLYQPFETYSIEVLGTAFSQYVEDAFAAMFADRYESLY